MRGVLRAMEERDLPSVLEWRNAEDVRENMYTNHVISADEHRRWWFRESANSRTRLLICEIDGTPSGVVSFTNYTGTDGTATWAFYSGDRHRRGVGSVMEEAALRYAFEELRLRRLECEVLSFNDSVVRFHQKYGFTVEGVLREAYVRDGKFFDILRLAMLSREWVKTVKPMLDARAHGGTREDSTGRRFSLRVIVDELMVKAFADAVNDHNALHTDEAAAIRLGFPGRIAHGMLVASFFSGFFAREFPGPGTVYLGQSLTFRAPVLVGTEVEVRLRVLTHAGRRLLVETEVYSGDVLCVTGSASLLVGPTVNMAEKNARGNPLQ